MYISCFIGLTLPALLWRTSASCFWFRPNYDFACFLSSVAVSNSVPCYVSEYLTKLKVVARTWSRTGHSTPSRNGPNSKSLMKRSRDPTDRTRLLITHANPRPRRSRPLARAPATNTLARLRSCPRRTRPTPALCCQTYPPSVAQLYLTRERLAWTRTKCKRLSIYYNYSKLNKLKIKIKSDLVESDVVASS